MKNSDYSNIKWLIQEVVVPIAIALIPLATTYITIQNTQQPPNPAIDRPTSSKETGFLAESVGKGKV